MVDALWSIRLRVNNYQLPTGGVLLLATNNVLGGDSWSTFVGNYAIERNKFRVRVHVKQYEPLPPAMAAKAGPSDYIGIFSGELNSSVMTLDGHVESRPFIKMRIILTRRAELSS